MRFPIRMFEDFAFFIEDFASLFFVFAFYAVSPSLMTTIMYFED